MAKRAVIGFIPGSYAPIEIPIEDNRAKPARELAARALCRHAGVPENTMFEGKPMWQSYLPEADAVLEAIGHKS
jgi:hypothetical protein